ncbi:unnamed protein product [Phytophthora fragariaefolia]|uniref:Unnamed protein product n=1 Tax=Phytophthora fragariaefolia TaxID=1490495 RepID=A0A9W6XZW2_9STRA|nr:unnamed protein product [Phytophthora fragariaefolia]
MTGLPATSPLDSIARPGEPQMTNMEDLIQIRTANVAVQQEALRPLHRAAAHASSTKRVSSRQSKAKARGTAMAQYGIGDYVLYVDVWSRTQAKLGVRWCGPAQVLGTVSNWILVIKNLITGKTREPHASRLKFYWDATLDVTEDLLLHIAHNGEGHVVKRLRESRYVKEQKRYEVFVVWRSLSELENPWEPATVLK